MNEKREEGRNERTNEKEPVNECVFLTERLNTTNDIIKWLKKEKNKKKSVQRRIIKILCQTLFRFAQEITSHHYLYSEFQ